METEARIWTPRQKLPAFDKKRDITVLPSFQSLCLPIHTQQDISAPSSTEQTKNHFRTVSLPIKLPSQRPQQRAEASDQRLSLDVLMDAIELDQNMYTTYKQERMKSAMRDRAKRQLGRSMPYGLDRRRSKSAPGSSSIRRTPLHSDTRWSTPDASSIKPENTHDIALSIVQQHINIAKQK
ncbi:hypothetical protein BCR43DRAFT_498127 [Syncephalastrum racemosum]|uniref:Uncharacterized protein n=1 Tax=Syncephalastrum racemosum TaxID=13706 RepID=A0A1X2H3D5_SYNRA|nr:hypothetical protein BCR43DRAFT_498127 [Syncephalastrum racemosum]